MPWNAKRAMRRGRRGGRQAVLVCCPAAIATVSTGAWARQCQLPGRLHSLRDTGQDAVERQHAGQAPGLCGSGPRRRSAEDRQDEKDKARAHGRFLALLK